MCRCGQTSLPVPFSLWQIESKDLAGGPDVDWRLRKHGSNAGFPVFPIEIGRLSSRMHSLSVALGDRPYRCLPATRVVFRRAGSHVLLGSVRDPVGFLA